MQNPELSTLSLPPSTLLILHRAGYLTSTEVLLQPLNALARKLHLQSPEALSITRQVAQAVALGVGGSRTVAEILGLEGPGDQEEEEGGEREAEGARECITSGDEGIDALLGGGVRIGSITEVAGQSAAGKSHLCLQMAITAQLPRNLGGVAGGTLFISSEGIVPSGRLLDLGKSLIERLPPSWDDTPSSIHTGSGEGGDGKRRRTLTEWDFMDNVHMEKAQDLETLEALLAFHVPSAIQRTVLPSLPIRLLIIDSIAAPFRAATSADSAGFISRSKAIGTISDLLHRLAYTYDLAIIVVNQISDLFPLSPFPFSLPSPALDAPHDKYGLPVELYGRFQNRWFGGESAGLKSIAALGHSWVNVVNTRLMLTRTTRYVRVQRLGTQEGEEGEGEEVLVRRLELVFSPYAPRASVGYLLEGEGVRSLGLPTRMEDVGF